MAYAQWVTITIRATNYDITLKNVSHSWGKFYDSNQIGKPGGDKNNEYNPDKVEGTKFTKGTTFSINACGHSDASSGTQGSFDIYDGDTHVGTYSWDCPWGGKSNTSTWSRANSASHYVTEQDGANLDSGALGTVTLSSVKF